MTYLYAPDYIINAGGVINASAEIGRPYNPEWARKKTERIYETMQKIIALSNTEELPTNLAADCLADKRLASAKASLETS